MALKIKFADSKKTEIEYSSALETEEYYNGSSRRTLTFEMARDAANIQDLDTLCGVETNVAKLELINDAVEIEDGDGNKIITTVTNIHEGYVLKLKVGVEPKLIDAETQTYEDRIILKLGKRTYIEEKLHLLGI